MKQRLFSNWTFVRGIYFIMGALLLVQAIVMKQWFGMLLGGYFAAMGLFGFGCAAGNCAIGKDKAAQQLQQDKEINHNG